MWDNPDWLRVFGNQPRTDAHETPLDSEKLPAAYLENPPPAYFSELPRTTASASTETTKLAEVDAATLLELDATALLEGSTAKLPALEDGHSPVSKEVAQILQTSLATDPHRVDIRIKLLEIYHHEVLGNRAEFYSLLNSLMADSRMLTQAQRMQVDKLQRTLSSDGPETTSELITKVAS